LLPVEKMRPIENVPAKPIPISVDVGSVDRQKSIMDNGCREYKCHCGGRCSESECHCEEEPCNCFAR
jgi:hypothetical protein